eukprot:NODE_274_length_10990_cov_0.767606.p10 type:complete len:147 gc:universal NODE_274_length_10990_cov_0.767606:1229-789(-)
MMYDTPQNMLILQLFAIPHHSMPYPYDPRELHVYHNHYYPIWGSILAISAGLYGLWKHQHGKIVISPPKREIISGPMHFYDLQGTNFKSVRAYLENKFIVKQLESLGINGYLHINGPRERIEEELKKIVEIGHISEFKLGEIQPVS